MTISQYIEGFMSGWNLSEFSVDKCMDGEWCACQEIINDDSALNEDKQKAEEMLNFLETNWATIKLILELKQRELKHNQIQDFAKRMIDKYGNMQLVIAIEELSELQKEISKNLRKKGSREHIIEEMADVQLIIEELKVFFGISQGELDYVISQKKARTENIYLSNSED